MFEEKNPLPGAESEAATCDWNLFGGLGDRAAQMGRHVIGAFGGVGVTRVVLRGNPPEPLLEVAAGGGVGILLDHQTGAGVLEEYRAQPRLDVREQSPSVTPDRETRSATSRLIS